MTETVWRVFAYNAEGTVVSVGSAACQDFPSIEYAQRYAHDLITAHPGWTTDIVQFNNTGSAR